MTEDAEETKQKPEQRKEPTIEDYRRALSSIQNELFECVEGLVIAAGYLKQADPLLEDPSFYIETIADIVQTAANSVKESIKETASLI